MDKILHVIKSRIFLWGGVLSELKKHLSENASTFLVDKISLLDQEVDTDILKSFGITKFEKQSVESQLAYTEIFERFHADYILIDLGCVFLEQNTTSDTFVWDMDDNTLYERLDVFIDAVRTYFTASHVLLLRYHIPDYRVMHGKYLKDEDRKGVAKEEKLRFVAKCEDHFIQKVYCVDIPLARSYFRKKNKGIDYEYVYEDEFYQDIANKLMCYFNGNRPAVNFGRANFKNSIKRYCDFYYYTICVRAFSLFLNWHILTELFVLSSTKETVDHYQNELLELDDNFDWGRPDLCIQKLENICLTGKKKEVFCLLKALWCIENGELDQVDRKHVKMLFRLATVSNKTLMEIRSEYQKCDQSTTPKDITPFNAGYYFALLNGDTENAAQYINAKYLIRPIKMDVFGSCVSRVCLNERYSKNNNIIVPNLWWHVPPYRTTEQAVSYDRNVFPEIMNYHMRNVKLQFDNCVNRSIAQSDGNWILIDLYSLLSSNTYTYQGLVYTDFQGIVSTRLGAKRVSIWGCDSCFETTSKIKESMEPWCRAVLEKYKDNIILLNCKLQKDFISDEDLITSFNANDTYVVKNEQAKDIFNFLRKRLNCYTIDLEDSFLADELGYSGRGAVHYELGFYKVVSKKIWYIVDTKPERKDYNTYSGKIRVAQIIRLRKRNSVSKIEVYYHNIIDLMVLKMPLDVVVENAQKIAEIYDYYWLRIERYDLDSLRKDILECFELSENLSLHRSLSELDMELVEMEIPLLRLEAHFAFDGWVTLQGTEHPIYKNDKKRRIEGIKISFIDSTFSGCVFYSAKVNYKEEWTDTYSDGGLAGTTGKSMPLSGVKIWLDEVSAERYSAFYRVHTNTNKVLTGHDGSGIELEKGSTMVFLKVWLEFLME